MRGLPDQDPPEIFGMQSNADITYQMNSTNVMLEMVLSTVSDEGGADEDDSSDKLVLDMITNLLDELPEPLCRYESSKTVLERGTDGSINDYSV